MKEGESANSSTTKKQNKTYLLKSSGRKDMGWYGILIALPYHGMGWDLGDTYHTNPLL